MRRIHRGHFPSTVPVRGQNLSVLAAQTSLWHDSQRTEASQDFYLFFVYRNLPFWAGISHFRTAHEILAIFPCRIC